MIPSDGAAAVESKPILCADDFAISAGVSDGIERLAHAGRLSATSALVTLPRWSDDARRLAQLADRIAIGLHINLTLGRPLGAMAHLAPDGKLPPLGALVRAALLGRIDHAEVEAEILRQIEAFRDHTRRDPDFIDGHQHVHALPQVRTSVLAALTLAFPGDRKPLVRDPADQSGRILARRINVAKSMLIATLSSGFGAGVRAAGFPVNDSFSGVSAFDRAHPYGAELARFLGHKGACHLVMCHPGVADEELGALDPVTLRREDELSTIMSYPGLPDIIWHPVRDRGLRWPGMAAATQEHR